MNSRKPLTGAALQNQGLIMSVQLTGHAGSAGDSVGATVTAEAIATAVPSGSGAFARGEASEVYLTQPLVGAIHEDFAYGACDE